MSMGVKEVSDKVTFWQEKIFRQNDLFLVTFYKDLCLGRSQKDMFLLNPSGLKIIHFNPVLQPATSRSNMYFFMVVF